MLPRERILAALDFRPPDVIPLRISPGDGGLHEHGQKLVDLIKECGHDFGDLSGLTLPEPPGSEDHDPDGRYHAFKTDDWGTTWEYRIFGIWGHPVAWPLDDMSKLDTYRFPPVPPLEGEAEKAAVAAAQAHRERYYLREWGGSLFETLHSVRRFEDVLADIALDTPEINRLEDMIAARAAANIGRALTLDPDGISFGDDYGTERGLLLSPDDWRRFFKPRYKALFEPIRSAGKHVFFHCCGRIEPLIEDLRDLGVSALWPQLPAFDATELAKRCRDLGLALELHPDRGPLMQHGSPEDVRAYVLKMLETFDTASGGSWLYIEIDPGFPWRNVEALFEVAMDLR